MQGKPLYSIVTQKELYATLKNQYSADSVCHTADKCTVCMPGVCL